MLVLNLLRLGGSLPPRQSLHAMQLLLSSFPLTLVSAGRLPRDFLGLRLPQLNLGARASTDLTDAESSSPSH